MAFAFRQGIYGTICDGVAVAIKGAPLMRLFRANRIPQSAENEAAAMRLMTIEKRFKPNRSADRSDEYLPVDPYEGPDGEQ